MAGVLCVWAANLLEASEQWYEDEFVPTMLSRHSARALLTTPIETPLDEEYRAVDTSDAERESQSLVIYEVDDVEKITDATYDESNHPAMDGPLHGSRFDVRAFELLKSWQSDETWNGDPADVASILFWEWQPHEGYDEEVSTYYDREIGPLFSQAAEVLRQRWFKIRNATVLTGDSYETLDSGSVHSYMCLVEMNTEDWPWGELFAVNELPGWGDYFEGQRRVKWQAGQYVVKRSYPDEGVGGVDKRSGDN